jgi:protein phosphatase-4 regulatory subunit 3
LADFQWNDKGCGHLDIARIDEHSARIKVVVVSETNQDEVLLDHEVLEATRYKRQQDTLILWTDASGQDLALSFQEKDSCNEVRCAGDA